MAIQVRRGNEVDFDATKMLPGEWAVSLDTKYVRMCFAPGVCLRMATYEGFEEDMAKIEAILKECQDIEEAVSKIQTEINAVAIEVEDLADSAEENALKSQSYAVGGTGTRENENIDNAKYYYNQVKQVSQSINGIIPMGTVTFAELPQLSVGDSAFMYNISDAFVSDERFNDGGGVSYGAGNNVFWTAEGKWDVTASSAVNGVKGSAEESFRTGNVTISPEDLGLGNVVANMLKAETLTTTSQFNITADTQTDFFVELGKAIINKGIALNETVHARGTWTSRFYFTAFCTYIPGDALEMLYFDNGSNVWVVRYNTADSTLGSYYKIANTTDLAKYLPLTGGTLTGALRGTAFLPTADGNGQIGSDSFAWNTTNANMHRVLKNGVLYGYTACQTEGTEETIGLTNFVVGNNKASGTKGNARGVVSLYGRGTAYTTLETSNNTEQNNNVKLPSKSGTLMRKEDFTIEGSVLTINLD